MSSAASDRPHYPRTQYNIQRPPHIATMDPSLSQQNLQGGSLIHSPENPYAYDVVPANYSNPNMAYVPGLPPDMQKHRGHPLKSFSIPAPPSSTPMIAGHKSGMSSIKLKGSKNNHYSYSSFSYDKTPKLIAVQKVRNDNAFVVESPTIRTTGGPLFR